MWLALAALLVGCGGGPGKDSGSDPYHPDGWSDPAVHGLAAKLQEQECTACHGADLTGSAGDSCDSCHSSGWRTDCTFCHGGVDEPSGAPPRDIDGSSTELSFPEHGVHVTETIHAAFDCTECHARPVDVLTEGHLFVGDDTPAVAETDFSAGLSLSAAFSPDGSGVGGTCTNLYCHSDGKGTLGTVTSGATLDCGGCHGDADTPGTLSGAHPGHLAAAVTCGECHAATASGNTTISTPAEHVDGEVDVALTEGMTWSGGTCTGTCHGVVHAGSGWTESSYHPSGWDDPDQHGLAAKLLTQDCTTCHGVDLTGGTSGAGCDTCHQSGWRTDCTYCHGGTEDPTGAPPADIDGATTGLSFPEHPVHVEETIHAAYACVECHTKPTDVLGDGHVFIGDTTPAVAEVATIAYDGAGTCSNLYCHSDGQGALGTVTTGEVLDCAGCHGDADAVGTLSSVHGSHLALGATCDECHADTAASDTTIADPALHVDGAVQTAFPSGMVFDGATCTGTCHGAVHDGSSWVDGTFHASGWDAPDVHGLAANLQTLPCVDCHGADLGGGISGASCDACHAAGWRTECTYCHGGTDDSTGAPPVDIDGAATGISFPEHPVHVQADGVHVAYDCAECHVKPADVLDAGHVFVGDSTPAVAEVTAVPYDGAGGCSNVYCHSDGRGTYRGVASGEVLDCAGCHGDATTPTVLSTVHASHLGEGATCAECHAGTAASDTTIADITLHVDGAVETSFPSGMAWDGATCTGTCHGVEHGGSTWTEGGFHTAGWDAPEVHGLATKLQTQDCTTCHGEDLTGGSSGSSCDSCHAAGWRTDCTYCHGGVEDSTGAPPDDIDGSSTGISFAEHTLHVQAIDHAAWDCGQCHDKPADLFSSGHLFVDDTTPGVAEVTLVAGLSPAGSYTEGTCANLYCHSDGQGALGTVTTGETLDCAGCHGSAVTPGTLSPVHAAHFDQGATCGECHALTATGDTTISGPTFHVDGAVETSFSAGLVYDGTTCEGSCHGVLHDGSTWADGGFHELGWDGPDVHGLAAKLQTQVCTDCHGADLGGGTSGESCDSCHASGWRTDCVYCHGGTDSTSGAPPVDIDGSVSGLSFDEHTVHIESDMHPTWGCEECHTTPTDVLSSGHLFVGDTTPAQAEVTFAGGLSSVGVYAGGASCSNLYCHGNGRGRRGSATTGTTVNCGSCHGSITTYSSLGGHHSDHLEPDRHIGCEQCHATTVSDSSTISNPDAHVDGAIETSFPSGMVYSGASCSGTCHGRVHTGSRW